MSTRWPLGRLLLQLALLIVLAAMCVGALGRDGIIGLLAFLGVILVAYAIIRVLR